MTIDVKSVLASAQLPSWVAAAATATLAIVALWTLPPILEDVRLKQEVQTLRKERTELSGQLARMKTDLESVKSASNRAKIELQRSTEELQRLSKLHTDAREDIRNARAEVKELRAETREERQKSDKILRLSLQREEADRKRLDQLEQLRKTAESELLAARRAQRVFILETLVTKAKSLAPVVTNTKGFKFKGFSDVSVGVFRAVNSADAFSFFANGSAEMHRVEVTSGREIVESTYNDREWELLSVDDRRLLQGSIRDFMVEESQAFEASLRFVPGFCSSN